MVVVRMIEAIKEIGEYAIEIEWIRERIHA